MICYLYRWRIKAGFEVQFIENWSKITEYHLTNSGSNGSRLHRGSDGLYYGYASWPSAEIRDAAFEKSPDIEGRDLMRQAIEESFAEITLDVTADLLKLN